MRIALLTLLLSLFSGNIAAQNKAQATPELDSFISCFQRAVISGDKNRLMELMDPDYRKVQHDKFHGGNTDRFLNELFCGNQVDQDGFKCISLKKVVDIELASKGEGDKDIPVVFRVSDKNSKIDVLLNIVVRLVDGEKFYGIYGGVG